MPCIKLSEGLHYVANIDPQEQPLVFCHFKYHVAFKEKVGREIKRQKHCDNTDEYKKYRELPSESAAQFSRDGVSEQYHGTHAVIDILSTTE